MTERIVARWQTWDRTGIEHLILCERAREIMAESVVVSNAESAFAVHYRIRCNRSWQVRSAEISLTGDNRRIEIASDGRGHWSDASGKMLSKLTGAIDIDLSITPFTNTLPIRRLKLRAGQFAEIVTVYIYMPTLTLTTAPQRYTCLEPGKRYRYESLDSDFTRDIEVDGRGLSPIQDCSKGCLRSHWSFGCLLVS